MIAAVPTLGEYAAAAGVILGPLLAVGKWITGKVESNRRELSRHLAAQDRQLQALVSINTRLERIEQQLDGQLLGMMRVSNRVSRIEGRVGLPAAPEISIADPL